VVKLTFLVILLAIPALMVFGLVGQKRLKREMDLEVFGESPLISKRKANRSKFKNKSQNNE